MRLRIIIITFLILKIQILNGEIFGGYAGSELRYGTNAREISLGGALVALSNSGFRQFSNPALVSSVQSSEIGISLFYMSLDRSIQAFAFNQHLPPKAGLGIAIIRAGTSGIIGRNTIGDITKEFSISELLALLSFGVQFSDNVSFGINLKISNSNILDEIDNNSISIDAGVLYKFSQNLNFGTRISNLIGKYKWQYDLIDTEKNYSIYIPKIVSFGSKYIHDKNLIIVSQLDFPLLPIVKETSGYNAGIIQQNNNIEWVVPEGALVYRLGFEKDFSDNLKLRLGFNFDKITMGLGSKLLIWDKYYLHLDYALDPGSVEEGISHNFSWRIKL